MNKYYWQLIFTWLHKVKIKWPKLSSNWFAFGINFYSTMKNTLANENVPKKGSTPKYPRLWFEKAVVSVPGKPCRLKVKSWFRRRFERRFDGNLVIDHYYAESGNVSKNIVCTRRILYSTVEPGWTVKNDHLAKLCPDAAVEALIIFRDKVWKIFWHTINFFIGPSLESAELCCFLNANYITWAFSGTKALALANWVNAVNFVTKQVGEQSFQR